MARLEDIRGLAEAHASSISSSPRDWMNYLDTAARLYRYPFMDQLLIHGTASTGNCLCVAGIMESKNVSVGKQRGKRNCPYR